MYQEIEPRASSGTTRTSRFQTIAQTIKEKSQGAKKQLLAGSSQFKANVKDQGQKMKAKGEAWRATRRGDRPGPHAHDATVVAPAAAYTDEAPQTSTGTRWSITKERFKANGQVMREKTAQLAAASAPKLRHVVQKTSTGLGQTRQKLSTMGRGAMTRFRKPNKDEEMADHGSEALNHDADPFQNVIDVTKMVIGQDLERIPRNASGIPCLLADCISFLEQAGSFVVIPKCCRYTDTHF